MHKLNTHLKSILLAALLVAAGIYGGMQVFDSHASAVYEVTINQAPPLTEDEIRLANIYSSVSMSVVAINVTSQLGESSGSGFVIDTNGHIVTNYHVVGDAEEIVVNFLDGTITRAEVVGLDPDADIAVIRVDVPVERLKPVVFGDSEALVIGQSVVALGSPFGQRWTLTSGVVSALDRQIQGVSGYSIGSAIQTDAPINPGNSGGPLFNLAGQVIGVNSQIISETRASAGIGFAVPSNFVQRVASELIETGSMRYSYMGVAAFDGGDVSLDVIEALNLPNNQRGMVVGGVTAGFPAEAAGLQNAEIRTLQNNRFQLLNADIIIAINNEPVTGFASLIAYLAQYTRPGDTVLLSVLRDGQVIQLSMTLVERPRV